MVMNGRVPVFIAPKEGLEVDDIVYIALRNRFDSVAVFSVPFKAYLGWDVKNHFSVGDTVRIDWKSGTYELEIQTMRKSTGAR